MSPDRPWLSADKKAIRERVWRELEERQATTFPKPARGRIPNFVGSREAALRLRSLQAYRSAKTIFVNPDAAQLPVREMALRDGKLVVMATPKLREGFIVLDPKEIGNAREAATIRGALKCGRKTSIRGIKVDLVVEGSVACDAKGGRLGKGGGFGDMEFAILRQAGAIADTTPVVTTVHPIQVIDGIPMSQHDAPVDIIVTPERVIPTARAHPKPRGIIWELLPSDAYKRMPVLAELREKP
jgi:5-formyltetrahydrofolate cyclo-ligase